MKSDYIKKDKESHKEVHAYKKKLNMYKSENIADEYSNIECIRCGAPEYYDEDVEESYCIECKVCDE